MDFQRIILVAALSFTLLMLWNAWQHDYGPQPPAKQASAESSKPAPATADVPAAVQPAGKQTAPDTPSTNISSGERVHVVTDLFDADIDTIGGDLRRVELLQYPVSVDKPKEPTRLLDDGTNDLFIAQAALLSSNQESPAPTHYSNFVADAKSYELKPGQDSVSVPLHWTAPNGVEVIKTYVFHRDRYVIDVNFEIKNASGTAWVGSAYRQLQRSKPESHSRFSSSSRTYTGAVISTEEKQYEKVSFDEMEKGPLSLDSKTGWVAMMQHYFVGAWIPPKTAGHHFYSKSIDKMRFVIGMYDQPITVEPGKSATIDASLYIGPKLQNRMEKVAPNLDRTVDYGLLTVLSKPLFWLLEKIHGIIQNWGFSIIILPLMIKLAFFKLSAASYKSMAHMRQMQPKMASIKERYADDRQKMNEAMMKLYKEEKINPLGGCLPILVQIPVFIALYYMLLENVELRQAPFILWIKDLSIADPFYVLPVLMGITMLIQQRLNPSPLDPIQARVMMVLPIVFTVFFVFFPAGLVLYWVVNNTLSILQQWYITRVMMKA